eukprot:6210669-Pleurochrysis_carterae.AAC.1
MASLAPCESFVAAAQAGVGALAFRASACLSQLTIREQSSCTSVTADSSPGSSNMTPFSPVARGFTATKDDAIALFCSLRTGDDAAATLPPWTRLLLSWRAMQKSPRLSLSFCLAVALSGSCRSGPLHQSCLDDHLRIPMQHCLEMETSSRNQSMQLYRKHRGSADPH